MTFDSTKPVQTRDGRPARIICTDVKGKFPIVALIFDKLGVEDIYTYANNGLLARVPFNDKRADLDLINIPETRWVNILADGNGFSYDTRAEADERPHNDYHGERIACLKFTEGEGLEDV